MSFYHLHVHTHYSLLDGLASPSEIVDRAVELGQNAVAISDHGNLYGAIDFYTACKERGIKPIIGYEAYVAPVSRYNKISKKEDITAHHLTLLAKNEVGYHNLIQLATKGFTEGFYYKPRIDMELLKLHHDGLICLSGCIYSALARGALSKNFDIIGYLTVMDDIFEEDFYIEVQNHGLPEQKELIEILWKMPDPIVATNDVHYLKQEDSKAHDALLCIGTGTHISNKVRLRFPSDQLYMKSREEMEQLFPKEWLDRTLEIADKCNLEIPLHKTMHIYNPEDAFNKLKEECDERIQKYNKEYKIRYERELDSIQKTGYAEYLLVVADFIKYCRYNNIPVGSGRGSSTGSLICFLLGITKIDPIYYGLLFERFINIERVEPPDIDVDISQARRGEVIEYLRNEYGVDKVAQIIAFGSMKTKLVIKDVCRVLQLPYGIGDEICKMLPEPWEGKIKDVEKAENVREYCSNEMTEEIYNDLFNIARKIEGKLRHPSTHAAGIVISDTPLINHTPLCIKNDNILTQYDMYNIEKLGLLKFDVLGLRTLDVIYEACEYININPDNIPLDDFYTYTQIRQGETFGVFQYEGWGYTKFIKRMQPKNFNDLIALGALYRPGPLNCLSGDTHIQYSLSSGVKKYRTVREWYQQIRKNRQNIKQMTITSANPNTGLLCKNGIEDVIYTGKKEVWRIIIQKNNPYFYTKYNSRFDEIKCTLEHRFLCLDGDNIPIYKRAHELKYGDYIAIKYWNKNTHHGQKDFTSIAFLYYRHRCAICGWNKTTLDVHHIDGDDNNNKIDNLIYLCPNHHREVEFTDDIPKEELIYKQCKNRLPNSRDKQIRYVPYIKKEYFKIEDTYDIWCSNDPHNFIANGFVVHNSGMADEYLRAMSLKQTMPSSHLDGITDDTYGILLYQEQVMQAVVKYAGFTMNEADHLRKAIGKKDQALMDIMLAKIKNVELKEKIETFARYGWNKAHAVSYALLSYQTAYLKFNHPTAFFCALLNSELDDNNRVQRIIAEACRYKVDIRAPDINISNTKFKLHDNTIYGGLLAIKGIGTKACEVILNERETNGEFKGAEDLRKRIPPKKLNSAMMRTLVEGGVFRE